MRNRFRKIMAWTVAAAIMIVNPGVCALAGEIALPENLERIEKEAFAGNTSIERVVIPESVEAIESRAFAGSTVSEIHFPKTEMAIADDILENCDQEVTVYAESGSDAYDWAKNREGVSLWAPLPADDFMYTVKNGEVTITGYQGESAEIVIPDIIDGKPVKHIGDMAFYYNPLYEGLPSPEILKSVTSVKIPRGVVSIGESAFSSLCSLKEIDIPDTVTAIGAAAFSSCYALESIDLPKGLTRIEKSLFDDCEMLSRVGIHEGVTYIGEEAFALCYELETIDLPESLLAIGPGAFAYSGIKAIEIPSKVEHISQWAFDGCEALASVALGSGLRSIGEAAFNDCAGLAAIALPYGLEAIGDYAFSKTGLNEIAIPSSVLRIGEGAFMMCESLKKAVIPSGVKTFGEAIFEDCAAGFAIHGETGSEAETYANENNIPFVPAQIEEYGNMTGSVHTAGGLPVEGAQVYVMDEDEIGLIAYAVTDRNGKWEARIELGKTYAVMVVHGDYDIAPGSRIVEFRGKTDLASTASLPEGKGSITPSFTMTCEGRAIPDSGIRAGDIVEFDIRAEGAQRARLVVDGEIYNEYRVTDGKAVAERKITQAGARNICFQAFDGEHWGPASEAQTLIVTAAGTLAAPVINEIDTQYLGEDVNVSWKAVPNADSYTLYLHMNGQIWPGQSNTAESTTSGLSFAIPAEVFAVEGEYTVEVTASGYGYSQSSAWANFKMAKTRADVVIAAPVDGSEFQVGMDIDIRCDLGEKQPYVKILVENTGEELSPDEYGAITLVTKNIGEYVITPYYSYKSADFSIADKEYEGMGESVTLSITLPEVAKVSRNGQTGYAYAFTDETYVLDVERDTEAYCMYFFIGPRRFNTMGSGNTSYTFDCATFSTDPPFPEPGKYDLAVQLQYQYFNYPELGEQIFGEKAPFTIYASERCESHVQYLNRDAYLLSTPESAAGASMAVGDAFTVKGVYSDELLFGEWKGHAGFVSAAFLSASAVAETGNMISIIEDGMPYTAVGESRQYIVTVVNSAAAPEVMVEYIPGGAGGEVERMRITPQSTDNPGEFAVTVPVEKTGLYTCWFEAMGKTSAKLTSRTFMGVERDFMCADAPCYSVHGNIQLLDIHANADKQAGEIDVYSQSITHIGFVENEASGRMLYVSYGQDGDEPRYGLIYAAAVSFDESPVVRRGYIITAQHTEKKDPIVTSMSLNYASALLKCSSLKFDLIESEDTRSLTRVGMKSFLKRLSSTVDYNDETYLVFISHGGTYVDFKTPYDNAKKEYCLVMHNNSEGKGVGFPYSEMVRDYLSLFEGKLVILNTACHSGALVDAAENYKDDDNRPYLDKDRVAILTACEVDDVAAIGFGSSFLHSLVENSVQYRYSYDDNPDDGILSLGELHESVKDRLAFSIGLVERSQKFGDSDIPVF